MKAVRIHQHGGPEVLKYEEAPEPSPIGPDDILIEVKATSVNHLDIWVRGGLPGMKVDFPRILGCDAAGIVRDVGTNVDKVRRGDRVMVNPGSYCGHCEYCLAGDASLCLSYGIIGEHGDGAYAGFVKVPGRSAVILPDSMSFTDAAAVPLVFLTAWRMLITKAQLQPGEEVLIHSASAGVGTACIQIARRCGARVIATGSSDEKNEKARALGANEVINHRSEDVAKRVRELTKKRGVDVVVDYIGLDTWPTSIQCLRRGGRLVTCGATTGYDPKEDLRHIFFRQLSIFGSTMGTQRELEAVFRCVARGELKPVIDRILPLSEAVQAHRLIEERKTFGKVVLTM